MPPFRRVLVANRGEIAIRVMRTCRELGVESVAVYSDADTEAPHVRAADRAERLGPAEPEQSYLSSRAVIDAALRSGAEAVHPGYGFLSENSAFAREVGAAGLVFVGPPPDTLALLGNKLAARQTATAAGVPVAPGLMVSVGDADPRELERLGYPLLVKAAAGGGGRGMRLVHHAEDLGAALDDAGREAASAFGDGTLYVERLIEDARHVEVQLLGDQLGNLAILGERDCSVQRRHQKLVEETPSPAVDGALRDRLLADARRVGSAIPFHNAATVEFLLDGAGRHWFIEMNTRLQVEHGVTELVYGLDLVAWQLRIAAGEPLSDEVLAARPRGHAIEARVYAEDPWDGFRPHAGRLGAWRMADGPGIRVDAGVEGGLELPIQYDALLAKIMVHAADRDAAVSRLRRALDETLVGGLPTTVGFHRWLVDQPAFAGGSYDTRLVPRDWGAGAPLSDDDRMLAAAAVAAAYRHRPAHPPAPRPAASGDGRMTATGERAWATVARQEGVDRW